jgi:hypothetical protein
MVNPLDYENISNGRILASGGGLRLCEVPKRAGNSQKCTQSVLMNIKLQHLYIYGYSQPLTIAKASAKKGQNRREEGKVFLYEADAIRSKMKH